MIKNSLFSLDEDQLPGIGPLLEGCVAELLDQPFGADPYWPKWDNHWWRLTLLLELGELGRVPPALFEAFAAWLDRHYLHHFPLLESELPADCDPYRQILCFCALGTAARILAAGGLDPWLRLPWLAEWLSRYRLPDGGYNCDEQAYGHSRKSSLVSTAPVLEALLETRLRTAPPGVRPAFSPAERELLADGLGYLLAHKLFRSSKGTLISESWLQPLFPRFYEYELLRGLDLASALAEALQLPIPWATIDETVSRLAADHRPQAWYPGQQSTLRQTAAGWERGQPVGSFALLDHLSRPEHSAPLVAAQWQRVQARLAALTAAGLITDRP